GFISIRNQSVTDALGNLNPTDGDIIKGKSQFAVYNPQLGWVGSLQAMIPGKGYMYYSNTPTSFVYPIAGMFKSGGVIEENLYVSDTWVVENGKYASNMTNILALDNNSCEYLIGNENLTIGAFDQLDECRGINEISLSKEQGYSFLTIAGNQEEVLGLQLLDEATQQVYPIQESITYTINKHLGTLQNPIKISVSEETCMKMQVNAGEIKELFKVYPTVIEGKTTVDYIALENDTKAKLTLYNIWGQEAVVQNVNLEAGFNRLNIDLGQLHLAGGMYHLVLTTGDSSETVKLIKE
ncbi:MAG: T9SS type A sorting domain-containing protein, partial [Bacteroidetes bacterium]|nr:T9SS type A sorting domain-containing protein [Bacteroidota bacterium]